MEICPDHTTLHAGFNPDAFEPNHRQRKEREMPVSNDKSAFVITRQFTLPRAVVWEAWSEPDQLKHWWGPKGCSIGIKRFEFRPGGSFITL